MPETNFIKDSFLRLLFLAAAALSISTVSFAQRPGRPKPSPTPRQPSPQQARQLEAARAASVAGYRQLADKKYAEAIASFTECLRLGAAIDEKIQPNIIAVLKPCYVNRGLAYAVTADYEAAIADYKAGLKRADQAAELYSLLGDVARRKKQLSEALDYFSQAVRAAPADPQYLVNRGLAYASLKNEAAALADFTRSLEINPFVNNTVEFKISADAPPFEQSAIRAYAGRAAIYKANKNYSAAIADYTAMMLFKLDAYNEAFARLNRAESYRLTKDYNQAIADYKKTAEIAATNDALKIDFIYAAKSGLGKLYAEIGDKRSAIAAYNEALAVKPGDRETTESLSKLQTIVEPQTAEDFLKRGKEKLYEARYKEAMADFTRAVELDPKLTEAYLERGRLYIMIGTFEKQKSSAEKYQIRQTLAPGETPPKSENSLKAIADFTRVVELDPQSSEAYRLRGVIYNWEEDYELAAADFRSYLKLKPNDATFQNELKLAENNLVGELSSQTKKMMDLALNSEDEAEKRKLYERVIAASAKILQLDSSTIIIYERRGDAYRYSEQFDLAEADYSRLLALKPNDEYLLVKRAVALVGLKKYEQARRDYELLFSLLKNDARSNNLRRDAYTGRGELYLAENDDDRAIEDFNRAIEIEPKFPHLAYYLRGLARLKKGMRAEAVEDFKKSLAIYPNFKKARTELGKLGVAP